MYYKEEWINGKLYWKSSPDGEWKPFTIQQYVDRCLNMEAQLKDVPPAPVEAEDSPLTDFIQRVEYMQALYRDQRYTKAEQVRDELAEKLDDLMRQPLTPGQ
jgi:hypothetical protein